MDDPVRVKLCELTAAYGPELCNDLRRCEGLLRDTCGDHKREVSALIAGLKEGVPADLLSSQDGLPRKVLLARLAERLESNVALSQEAARWAVESWALALGVISGAELRGSSPRGKGSVPSPPAAPAAPSGTPDSVTACSSASNASPSKNGPARDRRPIARAGWKPLAVGGAIVAVLLLVRAAGSFSTRAALRPEPAFVPAGPLQTEQKYGDFTIRIYRGAGDAFEEGSLEILKNGRRVYGLQGGTFSIGDNGGGQYIPVGKSITGDGIPELLISECAGGSENNTTCYVFQLSDPFRLLFCLENGCFEDLRGDSKYEFVTVDKTFEFWHSAHADSQYADVILQFQDGRWSVADDLMRKRAPSYADLADHASRVLGSEEWHDSEDSMPSELWGYMLGLIYSGHADAAGQFFDMAWPAYRPGKQQFLSEFRDQLATSPYWSDLQRLNRSPSSGSAH